MKIFYHNALNNFGDIITHYIAEKISGKSFEWTSNLEEEDHYIITGSILQECTDKSIVLGAGFGTPFQECVSKPTFHIVRGEYTYDRVKALYDVKKPVIGDPVSIINNLYHPKIEVKHNIGFLPHYIDYDLYHVKEYCKNNKIPRIDITSGIENVIDQVLECKAIVSSSLHGIIVAHAYNIPALWVEFSDNVVGEGFKFRDYFTSVVIKEYEPMDWKTYIPKNFYIPPETGKKNKQILRTLTKVLRS